MPIELKICGINSENIIREIIKIGGCSYLGFVFYPPSPRNLSIKQSLKLTSIVPNNIKKVAVLVKPENTFVKKIKNQFDYFQIYDSPPSKVKELKSKFNKKIIQAIKVRKKEDISLYKQYLNLSKCILNKICNYSFGSEMGRRGSPRAHTLGKRSYGAQDHFKIGPGAQN